MPTKPGIKTTEFWVALLVPFIGGIVVGLFQYWGITLPTETIYGTIGTAITYIAGRAFTKAADSKAAAETVNTDTGV